jgi:cysteinyl-tRNA synthetase
VSTAGIRVYDARRRTKVPFEPVTPGRAGMYVCGMTVQDKPHVGHMRYAVATDAIRRYLESKGIVVTYVTNFTDIDDRIIARANEEGISHDEVAERNIQAFLKYSEVLHLLPATHYPRATRHIPEIIDLIRRLIDRGYAYAGGGDVYFEVRRWPRYGELSGRNVDELKSGVRIEVGESKRDPLDFTLWKAAKPGEPAWDSPWGRGRPGWHIECSAMAIKYLGEEFDFHGGGQDLIFPHHENEIAQSEAATGRTFARYWIENGLVNLEGAKMSKSTKHFFSIEDVVARVEPEVVRFYLQSTHYRSPIEWSEERVDEARIGYARLREALARAEGAASDGAAPVGFKDLDKALLLEEVAELRHQFVEAMDDDFNTARAQGHLFEMAKAINRVADQTDGSAVEQAALPAAGRHLRELGEMIGLFWGNRAEEAPPPAEVEALARKRDEARLQMQWGRADELRDEIAALGYVLEDGKGGTKVRRKS